VKKFILEKDMKRGDAILFQHRYRLSYSGVDDETGKKGEVIVYGKVGNNAEQAKEWFVSTYENELNNVEIVGW
jgi:hypothetical protein